MYNVISYWLTLFGLIILYSSLQMILYNYIYMVKIWKDQWIKW